MPSTRLLPALFPALLLLGGCRSTHDSVGEDVHALVSHGRFTEALELAAERVEQAPGDEQLREEHRLASVAWLLERGRRQTFSGDDDGALATFGEALAIDPENRTVLSWDFKTRAKLAEQWYRIAREEHANDNLEAALEAYEESLSYVPDHAEAREGAGRVLIQLNYRDGLGKDYYVDGTRALHDYRLDIARSRFQYSSKYRPDDPLPENRVTEVDELLAQRRMALARTLEAEGYYAAARNEFHLASLLDPASSEALEGRERMAQEAEAAALVESARMMILRGELDVAHERVTAGRALTVRQAEAFDSLLADIDDARIDVVYQRALDLERDYRYPEAIAVFDELLTRRDFYRDARARYDTLSEYVNQSESLYARAREAETDEARIELLRQIEVLWPRYKNVEDWLRRLEASRASSGEGH